MKLNELPHYDASVNTTGCCAKFNPQGWDGKILHLRKKPFVAASTRNVRHVPVDMATVFSRVQRHISSASASREDQFMVLSRERSAWEGEHLFAVDAAVPGETMATLSGDFLTRVFEGDYSDGGRWREEMQQAVRRHRRDPGKIYFFYTTCPQCAEAYGKNYVVGVAEMGASLSGKTRRPGAQYESTSTSLGIPQPPIAKGTSDETSTQIREAGPQ
jgi:hypothetical protein